MLTVTIYKISRYYTMESESLHLCLGLIYGKHVLFCVYSIMRILNFQLFIVDLISVVIISPKYPHRIRFRDVRDFAERYWPINAKTSSNAIRLMYFATWVLIRPVKKLSKSGKDGHIKNLICCIQSIITWLSLIHISEPTRPLYISYAVFCWKKFFFNDTATTEIYTLHIVGSVRCV